MLIIPLLTCPIYSFCVLTWCHFIWTWCKPVATHGHEPSTNTMFLYNQLIKQVSIKKQKLDLCSVKAGYIKEKV